MALFSLTDINFKPAGGRGNLFKSKFDQDNLRYPSDLGDIGKGHYMVFYVNVQKRTEYGYNSSTRTPATILNRSNDTTNLINSVYDSRIGSISGNSSAEGNSKLPDNVLGVTAGDAKNYLTGVLSNGGLFRSIVSTTDSIALYMPDTLNFTYSQNYSDHSMSKEFGKLGSIAQAGAAAAGSDQLRDFLQSGQPANVQNLAPYLGSLSPFAAQAASSMLGGTGGGAFAALTNLTGGVVAENPQLELLYTSPSFREFRYSFMFYPRDEKEATTVLNIIDKFKFHQAPEIVGGTMGRFLVPPSEFDIEFHYNGKPNPNMPKLSTCVLTSIDMDYAPTGFAAYENGKGNEALRGQTGMPVGIRMDLAFKEIDILTKDFFRAGDGKGELRTNDEIQASRDLGDFAG